MTRHGGASRIFGGILLASFLAVGRAEADVPGLNDACQKQYAAASGAGRACETCITNLGGSKTEDGGPSAFDLCKGRVSKLGYKELCGERHGVAVSVHFCSDAPRSNPSDGGTRPPAPSAMPVPSVGLKTAATGAPTAPPPPSDLPKTEPTKSGGCSAGSSASLPGGVVMFGLCLAGMRVRQNRARRKMRARS